MEERRKGSLRKSNLYSRMRCGVWNSVAPSRASYRCLTFSSFYCQSTCACFSGFKDIYHLEYELYCCASRNMNAMKHIMAQPPQSLGLLPVPFTSAASTNANSGVKLGQAHAWSKVETNEILTTLINCRLGRGLVIFWLLPPISDLEGYTSAWIHFMARKPRLNHFLRQIHHPNIIYVWIDGLTQTISQPNAFLAMNSRPHGWNSWRYQ